MKVILLAGMLLSALSVFAQTSPGAYAGGLRAVLRPGEVLQYEFEGSYSFVPLPEPGTVLESPTAECDYSFTSLITVRVADVNTAGSLEGTVAFADTHLKRWNCAQFKDEQMRKQ